MTKGLRKGSKHCAWSMTSITRHLNWVILESVWLIIFCEMEQQHKFDYYRADAETQLRWWIPVLWTTAAPRLPQDAAVQGTDTPASYSKGPSFELWPYCLNLRRFVILLVPTAIFHDAESVGQYHSLYTACNWLSLFTTLTRHLGPNDVHVVVKCIKC